MPKFKVTINTGFANAYHEDEFEIDQEELDELTETEREALIDECARDVMFNHIGYDWEQVDD